MYEHFEQELYFKMYIHENAQNLNILNFSAFKLDKNNNYLLIDDI